MQLFGTPWAVARQAPLSMELPRQEYWSGFPFPSPGGLPRPGIKPASPSLAGRFFTFEMLGKPATLQFSGKLKHPFASHQELQRIFLLHRGINFKLSSNHTLIIYLSVRSCGDIHHLIINHLALHRHSQNTYIQPVIPCYMWMKWDSGTF